MCDLCDRPDLTPDDVFDNIRSEIARRRFAMISVEGSRCRAEFTGGVSALGRARFDSLSPAER